MAEKQPTSAPSQFPIPDPVSSTNARQPMAGLAIPWGLPVLGVGMLICFIGMSQLTHFTRQGHSFLRYFFIAFALYLIAGIWLLWRPPRAHPSLLAIIILFAVLFRVPLWFTTPTLSTDIWRYLWDGRLINHGVNPYAHRVDSPALDALATPLRERIDHAEMATPYPPFAEWVFAAVYRTAPESPTAMQIAFTLFDLATAGVLVLLLRRLHLPAERVLLYAWHPLTVVEFAHSAHVDSLMTLLGLLALYGLITAKYTRSIIALAFATLTKFIPALTLPIFIRRWGFWRTGLYGLLVVAAFVPHLGAGLGLGANEAGTGLLGTLRIYATRWKTNDGLFFWVVRFLEPHTGDSVLVAKGIAVGIVGLASLVILWRSRPGLEQQAPQTVIGHAALLLSVYLLLTPAMFPWYLTWLLALLPALPLRHSPASRLFAAGWLYFSAAVNLSYLFYLDPENPGEREWIRRTEYWPLFLLLGLALVAYGVQVSRRHRIQPVESTR